MDYSRTSCLRVLIVDDNHDAADSLAWLVELSGHEVRVAYDALIGLDVAQAFSPDCVFSDINMPGLDGYGLAQRFKSDPVLARAKLVAISGYNDQEHVRKTFEAGFDYRLTKGCDPGEVMEVLAMIEEIKHLATKTQELTRQNVELASQTKDLLREVKDDIKEVKQEVKELKQEVKDLKENHSNPNGG